MRPIITITDSYQEDEKASLREKTVKVFGIVVYRRIETYIGKREEKTVGFNGPGVGLTEVIDYDE